MHILAFLIILFESSSPDVRSDSILLDFESRLYELTHDSNFFDLLVNDVECTCVSLKLVVFDLKSKAQNTRSF